MSSSLQPSFGQPSQPDCEPLRARSPAAGRSMELELIPRLLAHARGQTAFSDGSGPPSLVVEQADVDAFVKACLSADEEQCPAMVAAMIDGGVTLERICLDLLTPAARMLGTLWEQDDADFLEVTLGLGRMQRAVRDLGRRTGGSAVVSEDAGQALICAMPEEQHSLGLAMLAEFFVADGWGVTVGPPLGAQDPVAEVGAHWYDVVGVSVGLVERAPKITELISNIRAASLNSDLAVIVGGRAFIDDPDLFSVVGADASAPSAAQGPLVGRTLVQARRAAREDPTADSSLSSQ